MEELKVKHLREKQFVEAKIKQLTKPKLGQKPLSAEAAAEQGKRMLDELESKQAKEVAELEEKLASLALAPPPAPAEPAAASGASVAAPAADGAAADANDSDSDDGEEEAGAGGSGGGGGQGQGQGKKGKAKRRREKKEAEAKARAAAAAAEAASVGGNVNAARDAEVAALMQQLRPLGLGVKKIAADGNCLFRAVSDQLMPSASAAAAAGLDMASLRKKATEYMKLKWQVFAPFLPYEAADGFPTEGTAAGAEAVKAAVEKYCSRMQDTAAWGGHPEIRALAFSLGRPIVVYQAEAKPLLFDPTGRELAMPADGRAPAHALLLSYHKHYLTLGEHYNSVVAATGSS